MITMTKFSKLKHQVKSNAYYIFWGACTFAVMAGQIYVGTGYRQMAKSMNRWFEETIDIITMPKRPPTGTPMIPDGYYMPVPTPDDYGMTIIK